MNPNETQINTVPWREIQGKGIIFSFHRQKALDQKTAGKRLLLPLSVVTS